MEERRVWSLLVVCVVLGLLVGPSIASFKECYEGCFILCVIIPGNSIFSCAAKCLKDCILPSISPADNNKDDFCKLGCALSLCANLSSKDNPRQEQVARCVNSCSGRCTEISSP